MTRHKSSYIVQEVSHMKDEFAQAGQQGACSETCRGRQISKTCKINFVKQDDIEIQKNEAGLFRQCSLRVSHLGYGGVESNTYLTKINKPELSC